MFDLANVPLLRTLLDQALPDALYIHGHDGRLLEVNQRAGQGLIQERAQQLDIGEVEHAGLWENPHRLWERLTDADGLGLRIRRAERPCVKIMRTD